MAKNSQTENIPKLILKHSLYSLKEQAKGSRDSTTDMKLLQCFMHPNLLHKF